MGLDMYLQSEPELDSKELIYWRKANHIHKYFDDIGMYNQDGFVLVKRDQLVDLMNKCYEVIEILEKAETETLQVECGWHGKKTLYRDQVTFINVEEVDEILPATSGFFFGSTDYTDGYLTQTKETASKLKEVLKSDLQLFWYYGCY